MTVALTPPLDLEVAEDGKSKPADHSQRYCCQKRFASVEGKVLLEHLLGNGALRLVLGQNEFLHGPLCNLVHAPFIFHHFLLLLNTFSSVFDKFLFLENVYFLFTIIFESFNLTLLQILEMRR